MKTSIGLCGPTGKTPELQIGQVKTVEHTQKASVEITGTRENPVLNFNIPKGKDGAKLIVREYFNGDIQILNNLNELSEDTNSDKYGKTVMSVNGIKQLLEKINDVLTKANANTNALGSLTSTVQGNKSDIETKLNSFKSDTDRKVQSINQTISELEQTIETKLNEELTKQVKALQDENKKLNDMIFENSLKENFEGSDVTISDTSNGVAVIETIKGQTCHNLVVDGNVEKNIGISADTNAKYNYTHDLKNNTDYTLIYTCQNISDALTTISINSGWSEITSVKNGYNKILFNTREITDLKSLWFYYRGGTSSDKATGTIKNVFILEGDWTNKEVPSSITGIESTGEKEGGKISILSQNKNFFNPNNKFISNGGGAKFEMQGTKLIGSYEFKATWVTINIKVDGLKNGHQYALSCDIIKYHFGTDRIGLYEYKTNKRVGLLSEKIITIGNEIDTNDIYFRIHLSDSNQDNIDGVILDKIQIEENTQVTDYQQHKEDKKEILLPLDGGLKSLPNGACDTIEQREDGVYLVQKVGKYVLNGSENWGKSGMDWSNTGGWVFYHTNEQLIKKGGSSICDKLPTISSEATSDQRSNTEGITVNKVVGEFRMFKKGVTSVQELQTWLQTNPLTVYYELATQIETKLDVDNINLQTFKDLTYVTSENYIKPVLKGQATKDITTVIKNLQSKGAN